MKLSSIKPASKMTVLVTVLLLMITFSESQGKFTIIGILVKILAYLLILVYH